MFESFKKMFVGTKEEVYTVGTPAQGKTVDIKLVEDPTFSTEMLGRGIAIEPSVGRIVAPADGTVSMVFNTGHAVSVKANFGAEILIHVGLNTVELEGKYYKVHVQEGDRVHRGDLLLEFDLAKIKQAGYDMITPVIICNSDAFSSIEPLNDKKVVGGDTVFKIKK